MLTGAMKQGFTIIVVPVSSLVRSKKFSILFAYMSRKCNSSTFLCVWLNIIFPQAVPSQYRNMEDVTSCAKLIQLIFNKIAASRVGSRKRKGGGGSEGPDPPLFLEPAN